MRDLVTPKQVARAIGVSESSLKRWCDQGLIPTVRTAGGHRRLAMPQVMRFLKQRGHRLVDPAVIGLPPTTTGAGDRTLERGLARLRDALVAGQEDLARQVVLDLYLARHRLSAICDQVMTPAFHDIGRLWGCGDVAIYQERRACEISLRLLHELARLIVPPGPHAPPAIGGTLEGDPYLLATTMAELVLCDNGWRARSLGNMLPAETIQQAIRDTRPRLVWLSVSAIDDPVKFVEAAAAIFETTRKQGAALAVGGRALLPELRRRLRFGRWCETLHDLELFGRTLFQSPDAEADQKIEDLQARQ
jgi:excisionase family DNA binding protein